MKVLVVVALIALVAFAGVEARGRSGHQGPRVTASSKTIVSQDENTHRFCIPIGKAAASTPKTLSLHIPRRGSGLQVTLDSNGPTQFTSPVAALDTHCKKVSSLFLVKNSIEMTEFKYESSEIVKAGAISGYIIGAKPEWISVRMKADQMIDVEGAEDVCASVLGTKSESAFDENSQHSKPRRLNHYWALPLITPCIIGFCVVMFIAVKVVKKCRARNVPVSSDNVELGAMPATEADEARDLALAIERSLNEKVVEVPQASQPQFVFLPPQFMPQAAAPGAAPAYVPMFAPQFMNYSLEERN